MEVIINIPLEDEILSGGIQIKLALEGEAWSRTQLGNNANSKGVYIHHSNKKILYVGKTTVGDYGNFGERFRREFQRKASQSSSLYYLLASQSTPILTYLLLLDDIGRRVTGTIPLSLQRKALLMESVLIGFYQPVGNRDKDK
jgi:hypothetical protein